jgi:hypothetical protein
MFHAASSNESERAYGRVTSLSVSCDRNFFC